MKILLFCCLLLSACAAPQQTAPSVPATSPTPEQVPVAISLMQVVEAFEQAQLPVSKAVVYNDKTDPNNLLGRPGQYVEKMNFIDPRDKKRKTECTVEVFRLAEDARKRKEYIDSLNHIPMFGGYYTFLHKNVLVRVSFGLVPADAEAYKQALESL